MKVKVNRTHLSLFVSDPESSARWYADILGMEEGARGEFSKGEEWIMMSFGTMHHDIALIKAPPGATRGVLGLQHYGLEIEGDDETLRRLYGMLLSKEVKVVKVSDHEVGKGVYFEDPDGNRLEFFLETVRDTELARQRFKAANAPSRPIDLEPIYPE